MTPPNSRSWKPRYRGFRSHHPARRFAGYGWAVASPRDRFRHEQTSHVPRRREELERLDRGRGVDALRAGDGALADERALPHARLRVQLREALVRPLVSRVPDVPQRERRGRRSDEPRARGEHGAGGVAEHAVDAQALLAVRLDLLRILDVLLLEVALFLPHDVRGDGGELGEEVVEIHNEVVDDREVRERVHGHDAAAELPDVRAARQLRVAV